MGDEWNVYAPSIGLRSSEALRVRSGVQFRKPVNAKWQSNFFAFFRLIGTIYAILQNERESLRPFYENTPFTAGSILYDLWRRRKLATGMVKDDLTFENPDFEREFLELVKVAGAIKQYTRASSIAEDDPEDGEPTGPSFNDERFGAAANALRDLARQTLVTDYYDALVQGSRGNAGRAACSLRCGVGRRAKEREARPTQQRARTAAGDGDRAGAQPLQLAHQDAVGDRPRLRHRRRPSSRTDEQPSEALPDSAAVESCGQRVRAVL